MVIIIEENQRFCALYYAHLPIYAVTTIVKRGGRFRQ